VYVVFTIGVTITVEPVKAPGFQVYVTAPETVRVDEDPLQIAVGDATGVTVIPGVTLIKRVFVAVHPAAFRPRTV
jgi:hypothetical protein